MLLNLSYEFFYLLCSSRISVWFFFIVSTSLLIFPFYSSITFLVSSTSLLMVFFNFLKIFKRVDLKSSFSNSNVWASSRTILVNLFFSLHLSYLLVSLYALWFCVVVENWTLEYYSVVTLSVKLSPCLRFFSS